MSRRQDPEPAPQPAVLAALYERVKQLREYHGDEFLSMTSLPAHTRCEDCAADYVPRGVPPMDRLLRHRHLSAGEIGADIALELAVADARAARRHSLEAIARPRTKEQQAAYRASLQPTIDAIKAASAKAKPPASPATEPALVP